MHKIESWDMCSARALARRARQALSRAVHGGVAVAAVGVALEAAGVRGTAEELQREATGGGGGRPRRVGASARRSNGRESREGCRRRRCRWTAARSRAGMGKKGIRAILQFPKVPGTKL